MTRRVFLALLLAAGLVGLTPTNAAIGEVGHVRGVFTVELLDANGNVLRHERFHNVVTTVGKNLALDTYLSGSGYTVTGPWVGLISNNGFSGVAATDTMTSHPGWVEAGITNSPTIYSGNRTLATFAAAAAGSKSTSPLLLFSFTGAGTVRGAFLVYGAGASATIDDTGGVLYSAGTFPDTFGVEAGQALRITYTTSM